MRNSFDYYKKIEKPNMYLCNPDRTPIGYVNSDNRHLALRFNDLSQLNFTVQKIKGTESIYDRIETKRLLFIEKIGWFQITSVNCTVNGEQETKEVTAESHQIQLKSRGFISEERVYTFYNPKDPLDEKYDATDKSAMPSVIGQLCSQLGIGLNLNESDVSIDTDYGNWTFVYIDESLKFLAKSDDKLYEPAESSNYICRSFKDEETYGYDFIINEVEKAFNVVFEFDFLYHTIKVRKLEDITKKTNIYLSLDNIVESISVTENAENIVTVLSCSGNDLDIRTVNPMGTNYIVNFDYYKKRQSIDGGISYPWMSQALIDALDDWETEWNSWQHDDDKRKDSDGVERTEGFSTLVEKLSSLSVEMAKEENKIQYSNLKLIDLQKARDDSFENAGDEPNLAIVSVENVLVNDKSLDSHSEYNTMCFDDSKTIIAYTKSPKYNESLSKYLFDGNGKSGMAKAMLLEFMDGNRSDDGYYEESDSHSSPLYFIDTADAKSYCKLNVSSDMGIVRDSNDTIVKDYGQAGNVEINGVSFNIMAIKDSDSSSKFAITTPTSTIESNCYFIYNDVRYKILRSSDGTISVYAFLVAGFTRYTTMSQLKGENNWCDIWEEQVRSLEANRSELKSQLAIVENKMKYIRDKCDIQKYIKRKGITLYDEFSNYWIEGDYTNDNLSTSENITISDKIQLARELMSAGEKELEKVSQPTFELSVSVINFIKLIEFKPFTDELELGCVITIEKDDETHYRPALVSIEYDLDSSDNFSLTFSTAGKLDETAMTFADLLNETSSTSRTISSNWSNLTDFSKNKGKFENLLAYPLDRTLRAVQSNMSNQEFTVDSSGILGRKWNDDSHTGFEKEQVRVINNTIIFTDDNWNSIKTAFGKIHYADGEGDKTAYGLIGEVLVGSLLVGEKLNIKTPNNSIVLDESGIEIGKANENGSIEKVFKASTDGDVYVKGKIHATTLTLDEGVSINFARISGVPAFATSEDLATSIFDLNQSFIAANGELRSEISQTYASKSQLSSEIQQSADEINLSISQTYATKNDVFEVSGQLSLYVEKDDNDQIVSMINAAADVIQINSNRLTIDSDNFMLSADGKIKATAGEIAQLVLETTEGYYSNVIKSENVTKTISIDIPEGTPGVGDGTSNFYWFSATKSVSLADLGITDPNVALGEFTVESIDEAARKAGLAGCDDSHISVFAMVRGKANAFDGRSASVDVDITYCTYTTTKNSSTISKLRAPDNTFDISSALSKSVFTINNIRSNVASINDLNAPEAKIGGIKINKECISANGINITFGTQSAVSFEAKIAIKGTAIFVYCDHVVFFDKTLAVKYSNPDGNFDKIINVTIKSGTSFSKVEIPTFSEITAAVFVDSGTTTVTFYAETPDDAAQYAYEQRALFFDNPQLLSTGYYDSTHKIRKGGALGSENNYWTRLYAYEIRGINIYQNGTAITTSDRNAKNSILYFDDLDSNVYSAFFDKLRPASFKYNDGESNRIHWGFIAQDIEQEIDGLGLGNNNSAIFCKWKMQKNGDENEVCGIRYDELIPVLTYEIQKLKQRVKELEKTIKDIKGE